MSLLFETILIKKGIPVNMEYHEKRFNSSRKHFWNAAPLALKKYINLSEINRDTLYRCRINYDESIEDVIIIPLEPKRISTLQIVICDEIDYSFKFINREIFNELLKKKQTADDILIIKNGLVTDTSIANIIFSEAGKYHTPISPLLKGTQRSYLIDKKIIEESEIKLEDIKKFSSWQYVNALNPFDESRFNPISNISGTENSNHLPSAGYQG